MNFSKIQQRLAPNQWYFKFLTWICEKKNLPKNDLENLPDILKDDN